MENDATIKERTARVERDKSTLERCPLAPPEDIGEVVQRAGQLSNTINLEVHQSKRLKFDARYSPNDILAIESPNGSAFTSTRPRLSSRAPDNAEGDERVLMNHTKGRSRDNLNIIDRLFSGVL